jgi:vacuolar protein sorting-associated protein 45
MTRFVENYPQFRAESGNVSKHVAVLGELSRQVDMRGLFDVSESEQTLACHDDHSDALDRVLRLLEDPRLNDDDRLRLVLLYALRYEQTSKEIPRLREILRSKAVGPAAKSRVRAVDAVLQLCGSKMRGNDLFGQQGGVMKKLSSMLGAGVAGVENVYTQHKPLLDQTLDMLAKGKLKTATHPVVEGAEAKYDEVYIFMVGGATYEEALTVANFNRNNGAMRVVLGSTYVHNSRTFLDDLLGSDGSEGGGADFR